MALDKGTASADVRPWGPILRYSQRVTAAAIRLVVVPQKVEIVVEIAFKHGEAIEGALVGLHCERRTNGLPLTFCWCQRNDRRSVPKLIEGHGQGNVGKENLLHR